MAFNGQWYIKVGAYPIPLSYMKEDSLKSAPAQRQDNDSYIDADGHLHRNPMEHTRSKLEFETTYMYNFQMRDLWDNITANYTNWLERKVHLTYYNEESDTYEEGDFYLPGTVEFKHKNKFVYGENRIAFIEY